MPTTEAISERLRAIAESPTLAITAKAKALQAQGHDVIGFGAGEPDAPTPAHVVEAAQRACADPARHGYSAAAGLPGLKEAIVRKTARDSGLEIAPEQVVVTNGGKHALYATFQALLDPGDEVLLPSPYWVSYPEQIRLAGGTVTEVPAGIDQGFRLSVDQLEAARSARTKALVFCSPSNPTGAMYPPEAIAEIGRWAARHGVWVVTDEIYEHLVFGDTPHASMPVVAPEVAERCVVVNGVSKTYAMTGWRVGWSIAPVEVTKAMTRLQSHATSNVCNVAQAAAQAAVDGPLDTVDELRAAFDRRRRLAHEVLDGIPGVRCPLPEGAFYVFPSVQDVLGRPIGGEPVTTSLQLCAALLEHAQVALVPGEGFGAPGHVRLSYALSDDDLTRGLERIAATLAGT